nr:MAG TPA: DnaD like replication protein [Caudoviricetes sp.]
MADNQKYYYMRLKQDFFETEEMIILESMQDGYLYSNIMLQIQNFIGKSSTEAERKRRYRDKIKLEKSDNQAVLEDVGHLSTIGVGHLSGHSSTRDRDRDRDRDRKEIEEEVEDRKISSATADKSDFNIFDYYQTNL